MLSENIKQEIRFEMAKALGWKKDARETQADNGWWKDGRFYPLDRHDWFDFIPDWPNDLNAMQSAWLAKIKDDEALEDAFTCNLACACGFDQKGDEPNLSIADIAIVSNATALQRAEAFLKTLGLWQEKWK